MNTRILVFADMMKTAGTSLVKQIVCHFGRNVHVVNSGQKMADDQYSEKQLIADLKKFNRVSVLCGHAFRPYIDFGAIDDRMLWLTFLRDAEERYVSHFLYEYQLTNDFSYPMYKHMKDKSIVEQEKLESFSNYQTMFLAGEASYDQAIEILEKKMNWVGYAGEFEASMHSFKRHLNLADFHFGINRANRSRASASVKSKVLADYSDFIKEQNEIDNRVVNYFKENIWPPYKPTMWQEKDRMGKLRLIRTVNMIDFQITRQLKFRTTDLTWRNLNRFYDRWYKQQDIGSGPQVV